MVLRLPIRKSLSKGNPFEDAARGRDTVADVFAGDSQPAAKEKGAPKSLTVRMPANHQAMLEACMAAWECDKSEAVKRMVRLANSILSAKDAKLITVDASGATATIPLVKNGVPV
jgi:hypothetical protein